MSIVQDAVQAVMKKAVALAPDSLIPGGKPDPLIRHKHGLIGAPISRIDGPLKVAGQAPFAAEFPMEGMTYAALKYSTIARGRIAEIDTAAAEAAPGVVLVMTHENAPRLKPHAAVHEQAQGGRRRQRAGDAGRSHPLERPAGRAGAGRDPGAGRPRPES